MLLWPIHAVTQKAAGIEGSQEQERLCQRFRLLCKLLHCFRQMIQEIHRCLMEDGDAIWCHWQALTGELLSSPLEFWSKALSSFADTHSVLRRGKKTTTQNLGLLLGLSREWRLSMNQVTRGPLWSEYYLAGQAIRLGKDISATSSYGSGLYMIGIALKAQVGYMKKWPKCPWSPLLLLFIPFPSLHLCFVGSSTWSVRTGREDLGLAYRWVCMACRDHLEVDSCRATAPLWDVPEGLGVKEIL